MEGCSPKVIFLENSNRDENLLSSLLSIILVKPPHLPITRNNTKTRICWNIAFFVLGLESGPLLSQMLLQVLLDVLCSMFNVTVQKSRLNTGH